MAATTGRDRRVGSLFVLLAILSVGAIVFAVIPIAIGEPDYAIPAGVLFAVLACLAIAESVLSRRQAHHRHSTGATEDDGSLPLMTVEITNPFGSEDHAHEVGIHDFPPGHPARRAFRQAGEHGS